MMVSIGFCWDSAVWGASHSVCRFAFLGVECKQRTHPKPNNAKLSLPKHFPVCVCAIGAIRASESSQRSRRACSPCLTRDAEASRPYCNQLQADFVHGQPPDDMNGSRVRGDRSQQRSPCPKPMSVLPTKSYRNRVSY